MSKNALVAIVVVLLLVAGGWYLMRPKTSTDSPTLTVPTQSPATGSAVPQASEGAMTNEVKEIKVSGTDYAFSPTSLSVKKGEKVKIVFQNDGKFPHNLVIDELKVTTKTINAGQTDTVEFIADKAGSYSMYCSVDAHRQKGMEGTVSIQ